MVFTEIKTICFLSKLISRIKLFDFGGKYIPMILLLNRNAYIYNLE